MQIYLARNNVQAGPYTLEQVNNMLASGEVLLDDLAWHEGMEKWQQLGVMTDGLPLYNPFGENAIKDNDTNSKVIIIDSTGKIDQGDQPEEKRLTVDQLYGRKPTNNSSLDSDKADIEKMLEDGQHKHIIRVDLSKHALKIDDATLAPTWKRVIATLIDWTLLVAVYLPVMSQIDFTSLREENKVLSMEETYQKAQELSQSIPEQVLMITSVCLLMYLIVQSILLVIRGQTLGKLATGIRVLDFKTHKLTSLTNVLLLRTIITAILYLSFAFPVLIAVDFVFMLINQNNRSIHDKIGRTYVANAAPEQLENDISTDNFKKDD